MWIFATYELLRTWKQRAREVLTSSRNGKLGARAADLEADQGYAHVGRQMRAMQLRAVLGSPNLLERIEEDLRRAHMPIRRMEFIRMSLAKHEIAKEKHSIAFAPGYGRINFWCGALDYQMEKGHVILGNISRRDIADELWSMSQGQPPTESELRDFDNFMDLNASTSFDPNI